MTSSMDSTALKNDTVMIERDFLKNNFFAPGVASGFLNLMATAKEPEIVLGEIFDSFSNEDWAEHKNTLFDFIINLTKNKQSTVKDTTYTKLVKLRFNYEVMGPLLNSKNWNDYLTHYKDNTFYQKLEPYFLEFAKNKKATEALILYCAQKYDKSKPQKASLIIEVFDNCALSEIPANQWQAILSITQKWDFSERLKLVNHFKIDPTYSEDTFVLMVSAQKDNDQAYTAFKNSATTTYKYSFSPLQINLSTLSGVGIDWFVEKVKSMSHSEIDTFFENKFKLQQARKILKNTPDITNIIRKEYKSTSAQMQDYMYLITFCNLILNPNNKSLATPLALALDGYLSSQMQDLTNPWWVKVQEVIDREKLRKYLTHGDKNAWAPIYEKIALDKLLFNPAPGNAASNTKRHKI